MNWWEDPEKVKQRAENYKKNFMKKHGVENPQQLETVKTQTKNTNIDKYGGIGYQSEELREKSYQTTKKKHGKENIMQTEKGKQYFVGDKNPLRKEEHRKTHTKKLKEYYSENSHHTKGKTYEEIMGEKRAEERIKELRVSGAYGQSVTPRISKPQLELFELIKEKYPTAILEYPFLDYCLDIAVPELKLCFEYDGSYWHQDAEKDRIRDEVLERYGWTVKRFVDRLPQYI